MRSVRNGMEITDNELALQRYMVNHCSLHFEPYRLSFKISGGSRRGSRGGGRGGGGGGESSSNTHLSPSSNRTPLSKFEPPIQKSWICP